MFSSYVVAYEKEYKDKSYWIRAELVLHFVPQCAPKVYISPQTGRWEKAEENSSGSFLHSNEEFLNQYHQHF